MIGVVASYGGGAGAGASRQPSASPEHGQPIAVTRWRESPSRDTHITVFPNVKGVALKMVSG